MEERIYGEDTGCLTQKAVDQIQNWLENDPKRAELLIYLLYDELDLLCFEYSRLKSSGIEIITHKVYENVNYARFYLMGLTKNFGVTFEPQEHGWKVYLSESFTKWYTFWKDYTRDLSKASWEKLDNAFFTNGDITPYLPSKAWNEE